MNPVVLLRATLILVGVLATGLVAVPLDAAARRAKQAWLLYTPDVFARADTIVTKGKERKFYIVTPSRPIEFSVAGPTDVRIVTRLLFTTDMKGTQRYTVNVSENGFLGRTRSIGTYTLTAKKSRVSTLASGGQVVPARGRTVTLHVPDGRHRFRLELSDTQAAEAAVRLLIPKRAVGR